MPAGLPDAVTTAHPVHRERRPGRPDAGVFGGLGAVQGAVPYSRDLWRGKLFMLARLSEPEADLAVDTPFPGLSGPLIIQRFLFGTVYMREIVIFGDRAL